MTPPPMNHAPRVRALAAALLVLLATAGCGSANAGSGLVDDFEAWMAGTENVAAVTGSGQNPLPFSGSADMDITLAPDLTIEQVEAVMDRAAEFRTFHGLSIDAIYTSAGFEATFPVERDRAARNTAMIGLVLELAANSTATTFEASGSPGYSSATITGPDDFLASFDHLAELVAAHPPLTFETLSATTPDEAFSVAATGAGAADGARAAYDAVAARYPVLEAHLDGATLDVRVDAPESLAVAKLAALAADGAAVTVQFGNVTKSGPGSYQDVDALIAAAKAAGAPTTIEADPTSMTLSYPAVAQALEADEALSALPSRSRVEVRYVTDDERFTLVSTSLVPFAPVLTALSSDPLGESVAEVQVWADDLRVVTAGSDLAEATALARALAATVPSGTAVDVRLGSAVSLRFTATTVLRNAAVETFNDVGDDAPQLTRGFIEGWNSRLP